MAQQHRATDKVAPPPQLKALVPARGRGGRTTVVPLPEACIAQRVRALDRVAKGAVPFPQPGSMVFELNDTHMSPLQVGVEPLNHESASNPSVSIET